MENAMESAFMAVTFEAADTIVGIDAACVEAIVRVPPITPVRGAGDGALGIVNLRGRIITVIDVQAKLGLGPTLIDDEARILVTAIKGESVGALVPRLADIAETDRAELRPAIGDIKGTNKDNYLGIFEKAGRLIALMDPEKVLSPA